MSGPRRFALLGAAATFILALAAPPAAAADSTNMAEIQNLFNIVLILGVGIGVVVAVLMVYAILKFRKRKGHEEARVDPTLEHHKLEAAWTIIPAVILLCVGVLAFQTLMFTDTLPAHPDVTVTVIGHQWWWEFYENYTNGSSRYANGTYNGTASSTNITSIHTTNFTFTVRVNQVVLLVIKGADVAHSFFIPDLGVHVDAIPGHVNYGWFQATQPGAYHIECTQFCGVGHSGMVGTVYVTK